ncbi:hypothetical protein Tcan_08206 [Toxocara canis]|uniref:Apple domain-containing protein n=1 Tax=Toxocara canis TaxID=6265 RepID=A0A0B2V0N9_TOXCA|nr:hypothetical protein Tcan_08206 [Toxocara canis]
MRAAFVRVLLLALLEVSICSTDGIRPNIFKGEYPVYVHTFDTEQLCRAQCQVECSMHHIDDLMMQRWLCPLKEEESEPESWQPFEDTPSGLSVIAISTIAVMVVLVATLCILGIIRRHFTASRLVNNL